MEETRCFYPRTAKDGLSLLVWKISNEVVEGLNSKIQTVKSNARGYRSFESYRIAILFHCGKLELLP